jgi:metal-responsive CopG/Arc/MetJ family transcriptional regulator
VAKTLVNFRLDQDLIDRVDAVAERLEESRTDVVDRCIRLGLEEAEGFADSLEDPVENRILSFMSSKRARPIMKLIVKMMGNEVDDARADQANALTARKRLRRKAIKPDEAKPATS